MAQYNHAPADKVTYNPGVSKEDYVPLPLGYGRDNRRFPLKLSDLGVSKEDYEPDLPVGFGSGGRSRFKLEPSDLGVSKEDYVPVTVPLGYGRDNRRFPLAPSYELSDREPEYQVEKLAKIYYLKGMGGTSLGGADIVKADQDTGYEAKRTA